MNTSSPQSYFSHVNIKPMPIYLKMLLIFAYLTIGVATGISALSRLQKFTKKEEKPEATPNEVGCFLLIFISAWPIIYGTLAIIKMYNYFKTKPWALPKNTTRKSTNAKCYFCKNRKIMTFFSLSSPKNELYPTMPPLRQAVRGHSEPPTLSQPSAVSPF